MSQHTELTVVTTLENFHFNFGVRSVAHRFDHKELGSDKALVMTDMAACKKLIEVFSDYVPSSFLSKFIVAYAQHELDCTQYSRPERTDFLKVTVALYD